MLEEAKKTEKPKEVQCARQSQEELTSNWEILSKGKKNYFCCEITDMDETWQRHLTTI